MTERDVELYKRGPFKFKILGYITRLYSPVRLSDIPRLLNEDPEDRWRSKANIGRGYFCDATLMLKYGEHDDGFMRLPIHLGDGIEYPTFREAQNMILEECGVCVEPMPKSEVATDFPRTGIVHVRVGRFVQEYGITGRSREEIEADDEMGYGVPYKGWYAGDRVDVGKTPRLRIVVRNK